MQNILKSKIFIAMASMLAVIAATVVISVNVSHSSTDLQMKLDLGNKYVSELDYENAIIAYEEALEIDPYCLDAYLGLSDAYMALGQEDKAIEIMEQARELLPENIDIYVSLAQLYASQNQINLAVSILEEGIQATGSDRLRDMLKEYHPGGTQTELAAGGKGAAEETEDASLETPSSEEDALEDASVSVGIRQDMKPVIVVSREDEEVVEIPLVVPLPGNNTMNGSGSGGGNNSSSIGWNGGNDSDVPDNGGGNDNELPDVGDEDDSDLPDNGSEDDSDLPDDGNGDDSDLPDDGSEDDSDIPDDGNEDDSDIPDDGNEDDSDIPDDGNGDDSDLPGDGDGDNGDDPGTVVPTPPGTGIAGNVCGISGQGLEGVTVTVYSSQNEVLVTANTDAIGSYLQELLAGDYRIVLSKEGYVDLSTSVSVLADALTSNAYIMLTEEESRQSASLKGVVISAMDSTAIEGATVALLNGFDNPSYQDPDAVSGSNHTTTGANGEFSMDSGVTAGYYTVVTSKDNYSTYHHNETIKPGENEFQISMSPLIRNQGVYRIVLEWGSSPRDLDSHITCSGNDNYHVYYGNKNSGDGKTVLDRDVTNGYGPETITLEIGEGNSYIYSVHNYTNGGATQGTSAAWNLANSGAKVTVYGDEGMIFSGNVPTHEQGITWEVFRIENGRLSVTNRVCFDHPNNLPQTTSADEGIDRQAASVSEKDGTETVPSTTPENGVQAFGSPAAIAENVGMEEMDTEEDRMEEIESDEAEPEEAEPEKAGEPEEAESEKAEEPEEEEKEEENADSKIEKVEETVDSEEDSEETEENAGAEDIGVPVDGEDALKPEEEITIEETTEHEEPSASDQETVSEETLIPEETVAQEETAVSEEMNG